MKIAKYFLCLALLLVAISAEAQQLRKEAFDLLFKYERQIIQETENRDPRMARSSTMQWMASVIISSFGVFMSSSDFKYLKSPSSPLYKKKSDV